MEEPTKMMESLIEKSDKNESKNVGSLPMARPYDIICGRNKHAYNNIGNRRFRITISLNLERYESIEKRHDRGVFISKLAETLKKDVGFRFLRQKGNEWVSLSENEIRAKIGHALRDLSAQSESTEKITEDLVSQEKASLKKALKKKANDDDDDGKKAAEKKKLYRESGTAKKGTKGKDTKELVEIAPKVYCIARNRKTGLPSHTGLAPRLITPPKVDFAPMVDLAHPMDNELKVPSIDTFSLKTQVKDFKEKDAEEEFELFDYPLELGEADQGILTEPIRSLDLLPSYIETSLPDNITSLLHTEKEQSAFISPSTSHERIPAKVTSMSESDDEADYYEHYTETLQDKISNMSLCSEDEKLTLMSQTSDDEHFQFD